MTDTPYGIDPQAAEAAANQITSASLSRFRSIPNPQLVWESLATHSSTQLIGAYGNATPQMQGLMTGSPAGSDYSQFPATGLDTTPLQTKGLYDFNWQNFWGQDNAAQLKDDNNASWRSLGEVPQANLGYMQGVREQKDPQRIKQWQTALQHQGWLDSKHEVSGIWDKDTDAAFTSMMLMRSLPDALYGKSSTSRSQARLFLSANGIDTDTIAGQLRDPEQARKVVVQWMAAQGPDATPGDTTLLQQFADRYGAENLPTDWRKLISGDSIGDFLGNAFGAFGDIPIIGRGADVLGNVISGNVFTHPGDLATRPQEIKAASIEQGMSQEDKQLLAPALNQVRNDSGFLGLFDAYDRVRTKGLLAGIYFFGDVVGEGKVDNPFDSNSAMWTGAAAHQDNFMAGILGDQWAHDHPFLAGVGNFGVNILDDPITYLTMGESSLLRVAMLRRVLSPQTRKVLDASLAMRRESAKDVANVIRLTKASDQSHGLLDTIHWLGVSGRGPEDYAEQLPHLLTVHGDDAAAAEAAIEENYKHVFHGMRTFHNRREALMMTGPVMHDRINVGRFSAMRMLGSFRDEGTHLNVLNDRVGAAEKMQQVAVSIGMTPETIRKHLDSLLTETNPGYLMSRVENFKRDLMAFARDKGFADVEGGYSGFVDHLRKLRNARGMARFGEDIPLPQHLFAPTPQGEQITEQASRAAVDEGNAHELSQLLQHAQDQAEQMLHEAGLRGGPEGSQEYRDARSAFEKHPDNAAMIDKSRKDIEELRRAMSDMQAGKPMLAWQLGDILHLPFSPYEIMSYRSPWLRRSEAVQRALYLDRVTSIWKRWVLAKVSTSLRIAGGDDLIRSVSDHVMSGHLLMAGDEMVRFLGRSVGVVTPGVRGKLTAKYAEELGFDLGTSFRRMMTDLDEHVFVPYRPDSPGYEHALAHVVRRMRGSPDVKAWLDSGGSREALREFLGSDAPEAVAMREAYRIESGKKDAKVIDPKLLDSLADKQHDYLNAFFADPELRAIASSEAFDNEGLAALIKQRFSHPTLPNVSARRPKRASKTATAAELDPERASKIQDTITANKLQSRPWLALRRKLPQAEINIAKLNAVPEWVYDNYTKQLVDGSRARMLVNLRKRYRDHLDNVYGDLWDGARKDREAHARSYRWVKDNTYQGTRTVMGTAMRNIFPFWGATSSQLRFYARQASAHPIGGSAVLHAGVEAERSQSQGTNAQTAFGSALGALGFTGGDALQFNPANAFFISRDGLASFVPGLGPIFTPLMSAAGHNEHIAAMLQEIPGLGEQIDYNTGKARPMFPWLASFLQGAGQEIMGRPVLTSLSGLGLTYGEEEIQSRANAKVRQREAAGQTVTTDDTESINREVGREMILTGALDYLLPVSPRVVDTRSKQITNNLNQWRSATTVDAKDALITQSLGVDSNTWLDALRNGTAADLVNQAPQGSSAPLYAYLDRRVPSEVRDQIARDHPWVVAFTTSQYESAQGIPPTLAAFDSERAQGNLHLLGTDEYIGRVDAARQTNDAWIHYDSLKQIDAGMLQTVGGNRNDPRYTDWRRQFEAAVIDMESAYPDWAKQFGSSARRDTAGLAQGTRALRTLQTWEVIPQHGDFETQSSVLWRQALKFRDEAASAITHIRTDPRHTKAEENAVLMGLQSRLRDLASQDKQFAAELGQFSFGKWSDVVTLEAGLAA